MCKRICTHQTQVWKLRFFFENFIFFNVCLLDARYFCHATLYIMTIYDMRHCQKKYFCPYTLIIPVSAWENFAKIDEFFKIFLQKLMCRLSCNTFYLKIFWGFIFKKAWGFIIKCHSANRNQYIFITRLHQKYNCK